MNELAKIYVLNKPEDRLKFTFSGSFSMNLQEIQPDVPDLKQSSLQQLSIEEIVSIMKKETKSTLLEDWNLIEDLHLYLHILDNKIKIF